MGVNHRLRRCGLRTTRLGLVVALLLAAGLGLAPSAAAVSVSEEIALGRRFELEARSRLPLVFDVDALSYLTRIGQRLVGALGSQPFDYRFYVTRDARVNAFAVPGGVIYVNAGLLLRAESDDELAGVLGHEIAHIHAHHLARQQEATRAFGYAALLGMLLSAVRPELAVGSAALQAATQLQYQREFEQEADYQGARIMREAGYDPRGLLAFFKKLMEEQRANAAAATPYLLSHPLTETRLTNLEAVLKQLPGGTASSSAVPPRRLGRIQVRLRTLLEPAATVVAFYRARADAAPNEAENFARLGLAYLYAGQADLAGAAFERAQQLGAADLAREIGRTKLAERQFGEAVRWLRQAVADDPADAVARFELGRALLALGDEPGARDAFRQAVELVPNFDDAHYQLGTLAGRGGDEATGLYHLGKSFYLRGEFDKAAAYWDRALPGLAPGSAQAREVGEILEELRQTKR